MDRVDAINARAAQIDPAKLLLTFLALPLLLLGWVASVAWRVLWGVISWSVAAVQVGWEAARPDEDSP
jgi:hypothetical protein